MTKPTALTTSSKIAEYPPKTSASIRILIVVVTLACILAWLWFLIPGVTTEPGTAPLNRARRIAPPRANADLTNAFPTFSAVTAPPETVAPTPGLQLLSTTGEDDDATATISDGNGIRRTVTAGDEISSGVRVVAVESTAIVIQAGDSQTKLKIK